MIEFVEVFSKTMISGKFATRYVMIDGKHLSPTKSQKIRNHSPDGFNWGYMGSGPSQLALAILLEIIDKKFAENHYQQFKRDIIAKLPQDDFELDYNTVMSWIGKREKNES